MLAIIDPLPPPRFVLNRGVLKYWRSEAEWRSNSAPLKDALYRLSHCDVNGSGDGDGRGGASSGGDQKQQTRFSFSLPSAPSFSTTTPMFGIILQPRNAQGGPRRMLLRTSSAAEHARWLEALRNSAAETSPASSSHGSSLAFLQQGS